MRDELTYAGVSLRMLEEGSLDPKEYRYGNFIHYFYCGVFAPFYYGGRLLGAVPSHFTELVYWRLSRGYWNTPGGHVRIYSPRGLQRRLRDAGLTLSSIRYVHFIDSIVWLRFCLTDFLRPARPQSDFEAAVILAVAAERPVPTWRTRLRAAIGTSRFISLIDAAGALVWPKSLSFTAIKRQR